jgi:serine/threonine protein kinase
LISLYFSCKNISYFCFRYTIDGKCGRGAFGDVKIGRHRLVGTQVAIKTITKMAMEEKSLPFPPLETKLWRNLRHPSICRFYHSILTADAQYCIMELADGDLMDYVAQVNGPISDSSCSKWKEFWSSHFVFLLFYA